MLQHFSAQQWNGPFANAEQDQAINSLENGQVLYLPELAFTLSQSEKQFLTPDYADPDAKNISFHPELRKLWGVRRLSDEQRQQLKGMLARFSQYAHGLVNNLLPHYTDKLVMARTSFRPVQVVGRQSSYRKDDKRLHVDAFPSAPNQGNRILRVFSNINPHGEDRVWRLGEPFADIANRFIPQIPRPFPGSASLLRFLKITKSYRTAYDHYMLQMHNRMKADEDYQKNSPQQETRFPPNTTWIVQTDHVSHAAMQGQYLLEQTFYLPVSAMRDEAKSPLRVLEKMLNKKLI
jgi:hypothetical protein